MADIGDLANPEDTADVAAEEPKRGCKSSAAGALVLPIAVAAAGAVGKKRKRKK